MITESVKKEDQNDLKSEDSQIILKESFKDIEDFLSSTANEMEETAGFYRIGEIEKGNEQLLKSIESLEIMVELVEEIKRMNKLEGNRFLFEPSTLSNTQDKMFEVLKEISSAQSDQDWVRLADLMEYELLPAENELRTQILQLGKNS